ncbi:hypothetical protein [Luedemannella helvata]|uniref:Uncharacterized protein n=1 Tax=Luedemannella helvata TaxID=349315 RepID=A0ABP4W6C7_9ACTN
MRIFSRRGFGVLAVTTALLAVAAGGAVAATTLRTGTTVAHTAVLTQDTASTHTGATYAQLGSLSITAGAGSSILVTFSAESACYGATGWCTARVLVDGAEAIPAVGTDFAFDSTDINRETAESWESHSMQRVATARSTGTHTVVLQVAQIGTMVTARYDDWTLTAMAIAP